MRNPTDSLTTKIGYDFSLPLAKKKSISEMIQISLMLLSDPRNFNIGNYVREDCTIIFPPKMVKTKESNFSQIS